MKVIISLVGLLTLMAGILPFFSKFGIVPEKFTSGAVYAGIIIIIGVIGLLYGFSQNLFGGEKFVMILFALLIILGGVLPFITSFVNLPIPTSGPIYSGIIILLGVGTFIYGVTHY